MFKKPIVTEIRKAEKFYLAEDYHQNFYFLNRKKNGYCRYVIEPKLLKLKLKD
jgi:peptide-methionine (S)-S-oxide reductase